MPVSLSYFFFSNRRSSSLVAGRNVIGVSTLRAAISFRDEAVFFCRFRIEQVYVPAVAPDIGWLVAEANRPFTFVAVAEFLAFRMPLVRSGDAVFYRPAVLPPHPSDGDAGYDELPFVCEDRLVPVDEVGAVAEFDDAALGKSLGFWRDAGPAVAMWNHQLAAAVSHVTSPLVFARAGP